MSSREVWSCPSIKNLPLGSAEQVLQRTSSETNAIATRYWFWRFDQMQPEVPLDNFWGKTVEQAVIDLRLANNPIIGQPTGPSDVELAVDPYFPRPISSIPDSLKAKAAHPKGRNRLYLDSHVAFEKDARLD